MASDDSDPNSSISHLKRYFSKLVGKSGKLRNQNRDGASFENSTCSELEISKQEMIKGVISLSVKNAREIMIPRVDIVAVESKIQLKELITIIGEAGHSRIPIFEDTIDNIVGILYVKDLLKFIIEKPRRFQLKKILHEPFFVPETMPLDDLLLEFKKRKLHLAIAVDEYGGVGGMITLEDILEEIVGEIADEFDEYKEPELKRINKNVYEVDSRITISDLNDEVGLDLPTDEFDTIGGLVFDLFGKIPKKDEIVRFDHVSFKIKDIEGTRINRIILTIHSSKENS
jgi:magnesium and cobalt transporter